ncbi:unnamed protein product [Moneuplotes crassus]|uniref:GAF domain-containing protein n=2 Tax=Euplotes crassus TaxID=5936 RepID=A0AAD2D1V3_EUPCR|nr:unnamed protein product [Moneuplotes crassus]
MLRNINNCLEQHLSQVIFEEHEKEDSPKNATLKPKQVSAPVVSISQKEKSKASNRPRVAFKNPQTPIPNTIYNFHEKISQKLEAGPPIHSRVKSQTPQYNVVRGSSSQPTLSRTPGGRNKPIEVGKSFAKRRSRLHKRNMLDNLLIEKASNKDLKKEFNFSEKSQSIAFGNNYQYNATSDHVFGDDSDNKSSALGFLSKIVENNEKELKKIMKMKKSNVNSIQNMMKRISQTPSVSSDGKKVQPFHRTVNSFDAQSSAGVKSKQILFYSDLVHCYDLNKLFTVLDKTPSYTSLSICRERIKIDLNKLIIYEEEITRLYELLDKVTDYFKLIDFREEYRAKIVSDTINPSIKFGNKDSINMLKKSNTRVPKTSNSGNKPAGAKETYREFIKNKARDFSKIETEYYQIKEILKKTQEGKLNMEQINSTDAQKCNKYQKQIASIKAQLEAIQKLKLTRDEENLVLKYENQTLKTKIENYQDEIEKLALNKKNMNSSSDQSSSERSSFKSDSFDEKDSFMNNKNDYEASERDDKESKEEEDHQKLIQRPKLLRKGTIDPNLGRLSDGARSQGEVKKEVNYRHFISRKGFGSGFGIEGLRNQGDEGEKNNSGTIKIGWMYDFISCMELAVKENNTKQIMNKYCNTFKNLLDVERIHILKLNKVSTKFTTTVKGEKREVLITERLLFKIFKETKMLTIHDTSDNRMFDPRFNKFFGLRIKNLLAIPIINSNGTLCAIAMILNRSKPVKITEKGILMYSKTHELMAHMLSYLVSNLFILDSLRTMKQKETERIEILIDSTEKILSVPSSGFLISQIESFVKKFMDCQRVTFYLFDSKRNELYTLYATSKSEYRILSYSSQKGICGFVVSTGTSVILHEVYDDNRYNPEIDDPRSDGDIFSLLTVPILCSNLNPNMESNESSTKGVLQLANKKDGTQFDANDRIKTEELGVILGRFQNVIFCLEDFFATCEREKKKLTRAIPFKEIEINFSASHKDA